MPLGAVELDATDLPLGAGTDELAWSASYLRSLPPLGEAPPRTARRDWAVVVGVSIALHAVLVHRLARSAHAEPLAAQQVVVEMIPPPIEQPAVPEPEREPERKKDDDRGVVIVDFCV